MNSRYLAFLIGALMLGSGAPRAEERPLIFEHASVSLDPAIVSHFASYRLQTTILEGLVRVGRDGSIEPGVAESWKENVEEATTLVKLKRDRKWSDGQPVVAQDFIAGWRAVLRRGKGKNAHYRSLLRLKGAKAFAEGQSEEMPGLKAIDAYTLKISFDDFDRLFVMRTFNGSLMPAPAHFVERYPDDWFSRKDKPFNGFYRPDPESIVAFHADTNQPLNLIVNTLHPEHDQVRIKRIKFIKLRYQQQFVAGNWRPLFEAQDVPSVNVGFGGVDPLLEVQLKRAGWVVAENDENSTTYLYINRKRVSAKLIEALKYALSPREYASRNPTVLGKSTHRFFNMKGNPHNVSSRFNLSGKERSHKAKKLFGELGISPKTPKDLYIPAFNQIASGRKPIEAMLRPYGIRARTEITTTQTMAEDCARADAVLMHWGVSLPDPSGSFYALNMQDYRPFTPRWQKEFDEIIHKSSLATPEERLVLLAKAEELLLNHGAIVPLMHHSTRLVYRRGLTGIAPSSTRIFPPQWLAWRKDTPNVGE